MLAHVSVFTVFMALATTEYVPDALWFSQCGTQFMTMYISYDSILADETLNKGQDIEVTIANDFDRFPNCSQVVNASTPYWDWPLTLSASSCGVSPVEIAPDVFELAMSLRATSLSQINNKTYYFNATCKFRNVFDAVQSVDCSSASPFVNVTLNDDSILANETYMKPPLGTAIGITLAGHDKPQFNCSAVIAGPPIAGRHTPSFRLYYYACNQYPAEISPHVNKVTIPLQAVQILQTDFTYNFNVTCEYSTPTTAATRSPETSTRETGCQRGGCGGSSIEGLVAGWHYESNGEPVGAAVVNVAKKQKLIFRVAYFEDIYGAVLPVLCFLADRKYTYSPVHKHVYVSGSCPAYDDYSFPNANLTHTQIDLVFRPPKFAESDLVWGYCYVNACINADDARCEIQSCWSNASADCDLETSNEQPTTGYVYSSLAVRSSGGPSTDNGVCSGSNVDGLHARWFYASNGSAVGSARVALGTRVVLKFSYTGDVYFDVLPFSCYIGNAETKATESIYFVYGSCPAAHSTFLNFTLHSHQFSFEQEMTTIRFAGSYHLWGYCQLNACPDVGNANCQPGGCWQNPLESLTSSDPYDSVYAYASMIVADDGDDARLKVEL